MAMDKETLAQTIMTKMFPDGNPKDYDKDTFEKFCDGIIEHIKTKMEIQTVVNTAGSATSQTGTGMAGLGTGVIK